MEIEDRVSDSWQLLQQHYEQIDQVELQQMFVDDANRFERYSLDAAGLFLDYSKNRIGDETLKYLLELAKERQVETWIRRMISGEKINSTENRAVLHIALRNQSDRAIMVDGCDVMPAVRSVKCKISKFVDSVHTGEWRGITGKTITDIVNIGIGGSDLGPRMVVDALRDFWIPGLRTHFIANIDGADLSATLSGLNAETTLFIVASKTFTTQETMTNARSARSWFFENIPESTHIDKHFVAVSTNQSEVEAFGIDSDNMFEFWDWVGGRYSLWSAIGLSIALAVGVKNFNQLLEGAFAMDEHFQTAPIEKNMPMIMALIGIWNRNILGADSLAILPYDQRLHRFPAYLQQCDMESNGKTVGCNGQPVSLKTGPIIWGEPGTNGQHAFYQLIHQGSNLVPVDFIVAMQGDSGLQEHHDILVANCFAQAEALMIGKTTQKAYSELAEFECNEETRELLAKHKTFSGNKPSNMLIMDSLSPKSLGALIALYEHKIFVQGVIWGINSFDQWGVELGKQLANALLVEIEGELNPGAHDSSTRGLLKRYKDR